MCHASWGHCGPGQSSDSGHSHFGSRRRAWAEYFMRGGGRGGPREEGFDGGGFGAAFGVRRPLRLLAHKLDLDEKQIVEIARILDELKTERAQAAVDDRRTLSEFADALSGEAFDPVKATSAGERRVGSAARLRDSLVNSLRQIHATLNAEQRGKLAHLIRTGVLAM